MSEEQKPSTESEPLANQAAPPVDDPLGTLAGHSLDEIAKSRDDLQQRLLLAQAEFENYRKRSQKEQDQERQYRSLPIVRDLLPVMDNLRRALDASTSAQAADKLVEGVRMVVQQFEDILGKHSIMPIPAVGQPFNPTLHEALTQAPSADHPPMTVLMEVERGYQLFERIVRPAKVIVSIAPPSA